MTLDAGIGRASDQAPIVLRVEGMRTWFPIHKGPLRRRVAFVRAVDGIDLTVRSGRTLGLIGESGSGKTTAALSILRLVEPQQGRIWFEGVDLRQLRPAQLRPFRKNLQIIFQDALSALDPNQTVQEVLEEALRAVGAVTRRGLQSANILRLLQMVELESDLRNRYPSELSSGQRQRVGIARALAVNPKVLVCDEIVSALDVATKARLVHLLRRLQQDLGLAYLFISHDLSVIRQLADDVAVMYRGRVIEEGPSGDVLANPQHPYTRELLASTPSLTSALQNRREVPAGVEEPELESPAQGCPYALRCSEAQDACLVEAPPLFAVGRGRVRCFLRASRMECDDIVNFDLLSAARGSRGTR